MSDTSIVEYDDYGDEPHHDSYRRRGNCWTNIGANVCVGILAFTTIVLAAVLGYVLYEQNQKGNAIRRAQGNGADNEHIQNAAGHFAGGVLDAMFGDPSYYSE